MRENELMNRNNFLEQNALTFIKNLEAVNVLQNVNNLSILNVFIGIQ